MAEKDFKKMLKMNKEKFKCPTCKIRQNTKTAVSPTNSVSSEIFPIDFERYMSHIDAKIDKFATTFSEQIKSDLKELIVSSISAELGAINAKISSFDNMEKSLEFHTVEQDRLKAIIADSVKLIENLQASNDLLRKDFDKLKSKFEEIEQLNRQCNIEIQNVPEINNENVLNIVASLATALNMSIPTEQVRSAHRVAAVKSDRPRNIIVQLATRRLRDDIIAAARVRRSLTTQSLQLSVPVQSIYVNEHLTLANKILYAKVRAAKKQKGYEHAWIRNSKIYVRKHSGDKFIVIKCESDLLKM